MQNMLKRKSKQRNKKSTITRKSLCNHYPQTSKMQRGLTVFN